MPPNVLLIRRRYLGDIVLLGAVLRHLREQWPAARLTVLVEPAFAGVLAMNPDVDAVLRLPAGPGAWPRFLLDLRRGGFTHVLDYDNTEKTAVLGRLTGARHRLTLSRQDHRLLLPRLYTQIVAVSPADDTGRHITETYLDLPRALGLPARGGAVRLTPRAADLAFADDLLRNLPEPRLLVHPGSRSAFRLWPADRFARVIDRVQSELHTAVALIAGPAEQAVVADIATRCVVPPHRVAGTLTLPQLAALMSRFPAMLCHDSGPMHLANAVGTRVVALYGSQNATIWRPLGAGNAVLQTPLPCTCLPSTPVPCVRDDAYKSYCVRKLGADEVFAAVAAALAPRPA